MPISMAGMKKIWLNSLCLAGQTELNTQIHIDQNAKSPLYILLKIHHSGREPENYDTHMDQKAKQKISKCRNLPH